MSMSEQRAVRAKADLVHYFNRAGIEETADSQHEIEEIVDCIIDAAVLCVVENHLGKSPEPEARTPHQIVAQCEELACEMARAEGYRITAIAHQSKNPHVQLFFRRAAIAMEILQKTSVNDAISELE